MNYPKPLALLARVTCEKCDATHDVEANYCDAFPGSYVAITPASESRLEASGWTSPEQLGWLCPDHAGGEQ